MVIQLQKKGGLDHWVNSYAMLLKAVLNEHEVQLDDLKEFANL